MGDIRLSLQKNLYASTLDFYLSRVLRDEDGRPHNRNQIAEVVFRDVEPGMHPTPSFRFSERTDGNAVQSLMDDLWFCGVRPTAGVGSAGQLSATERHLADMQKLVFEHLIARKY